MPGRSNISQFVHLPVRCQLAALPPGQLVAGQPQSWEGAYSNKQGDLSLSAEQHIRAAFLFVIGNRAQTNHSNAPLHE